MPNNEPTAEERAKKIERQIYSDTGRGLLALNVEGAVLGEIRAAVQAERERCAKAVCPLCAAGNSFNGPYIHDPGLNSRGGPCLSITIRAEPKEESQP